SGVVQRPAPAPARPAPPPSRTPSITAPSSYGPVQRSETLWSIAQEVRPDPAISTNQMMMALFRANPDAFDGNINRMRAGARLRVPGSDEILGITPAEATAEVRSQNTRWRSASGRAVGSAAASTGAAPSRPQVTEEPRLELVPPSETGAAGSAAAVGQASSEQEALNQELLNAVQSLRDELEETRDAISVKDAEIAALQQRLAMIDGGQAAAVDELDAEFDPDSVQRAIAEAEAEAAVAAATEQAAAESETSELEEEALVEEEIAASEQAATVTQPPAAQISGGRDEAGLFSSMWIWIAGFAALLAALFFFWKRRQEADTEEAFEAWEPKPEREPRDLAETSPAILVEEQTHPGTAGLAAAGAAAATATDAGLDFGDTESMPAEADASAAGKPATEMPVDEPTGADYQYPFEDTIAGATGINLEQSDPLAEADFHMAYGLYDQAADLIRKAIGREPDRVDLRLKMLDILFVWGKGEDFVTEAQALRELGSAEPTEWSRVAIMGRQIAPEQSLFEDQGDGHAGVDVAVSGDGAAGSDIDPAGSGDDLDFDFGDSGTETESRDEDVLDFDIGATGEMPAPAPWDATQEREVMPDATAELEIEDLGLDVNLEDLEESTRSPDEMDIEGTGITEIIVRDDDSRFADIDASDTEVLEDQNSNTGTIDQDSGDTEVLEKAVINEDDDTGITEMLEAAEDLATDTSGAYSVEELEQRKLDEDTRELEQVDAEDAAESGGTSIMKALEMPAEESTDELADDQPADDDTAEVQALDEDEDSGLDLEDITAALGRDLEKTAEMPVAGSADDAETLIADIFGDDEATRVAPRHGVLAGADQDPEATREMPRVEMPDVTLSEVGTKLDLARAYIDMGDPDGARSILGEVLEEGDDGQKSEAKDLLDGLG
ncbi:MAG: FimV/HubP family polar landmark protein, partial [Gammaproteobacteria bacterium]